MTQHHIATFFLAFAVLMFLDGFITTVILKRRSGKRRSPASFGVALVCAFVFVALFHP